MLARRAGAEGVRLSFVIEFSRQLGEEATTEAAAAELVVPATAASKLKCALAAVPPPTHRPGPAHHAQTCPPRLLPCPRTTSPRLSCIDMQPCA